MPHLNTAHQLAHAAASAPLSEQLALPGFIVQVVGALLGAVGIAVAVWAAKRAAPAPAAPWATVVPMDELREAIEQRLRETLAEAARLRVALDALNGGPAPGAAAQSSVRHVRARTRPQTAADARSAARPARRRRTPSQPAMPELQGRQRPRPSLKRATVTSTPTRPLDDGTLPKPQRGHRPGGA